MRLIMVHAVVLGLASLAMAEATASPFEYKLGDLTFQGHLVHDAAVQGKKPAVLIVHEWWGLNDFAKARAAKIAEMGYVALAVDMYGKGVRATTVDEAGKLAGGLKKDIPTLRARIRAALDALAAQPTVDPTRIAVMGYCFGGTVSLELARSGAPIVGAVSFHGALGTPDPADARNIKGKVLVLHGAEDPFVPDAEVGGFVKEMRDARVNYTVVAYGGAVHSFTNPAADKLGMNGVAYQKQADERSWAALTDFLREVFAR